MCKYTKKFLSLFYSFLFLCYLSQGYDISFHFISIRHFFFEAFWSKFWVKVPSCPGACLLWSSAWLRDETDSGWGDVSGALPGDHHGPGHPLTEGSRHSRKDQKWMVSFQEGGKARLVSFSIHNKNVQKSFVQKWQENFQNISEKNFIVSIQVEIFIHYLTFLFWWLPYKSLGHKVKSQGRHGAGHCRVWEV